MKTFIFAFLIAVLMITGCTRKSDVTIKVSGTAGVNFIGNCVSSTDRRVLQSKELKETVPVNFTLTGTVVVCYFQKQGTEGTLKVDIMKNSKVAFMSETSTPEGVIMATVGR